MAVQGPIPVEFATVFPRGVFAAGPCEPVRDFDASKDGRFVPSKDTATGLPMWVAEVIDGDPEARVKSLRVKVAAADQPVLPAPHPGMPFVPVEFAGLTVTPYVNQAGRLSYSLKASGVQARPLRLGVHEISSRGNWRLFELTAIMGAELRRRQEKGRPQNEH